MVKINFKNIDLLRKRRETSSFADPYFIDNKKYIKIGIYRGLLIIMSSLIMGIPFIFRTKFLESKKDKIKIFSDEYDLISKKLDGKQKEINKIISFNKKLKNSILNVNASSALFQEIALVIPKDIQLLSFLSKGDSLFLKAKITNSKYLETLNSFLLTLDNSELVRFNEIDVKKINISDNNISDNNNLEKAYLVEIQTKVSTEYQDINKKYLIKLGSLGLFNRLNILNSIDRPLN
tara:strand:+ start:57 stop:761 length:705 start_codon:yes stop_codon:yes gene_type:complete